jgi:hypothetical protein
MLAAAKRSIVHLPETLAWHVDSRGRQSRRRLPGLRDAHRGQRCFIIGNGPSLRETDLTLLRNEATFGLNRIYLIFDELGFNTTYLVTVNRLVVEQCRDEIAALPIPKFTTWGNRDLVPFTPNTLFLRSLPGPRFFTDITHGIWEGATVTFVAMQIAYYLGFQKVILIGVDHSFAAKGQRHKVVVSHGDDPNHFDPRYFGKGFRWQLPDLETSEVAYGLARARFEADGREILDATIGGKLQVFRKASYQELFA